MNDLHTTPSKALDEGRLQQIAHLGTNRILSPESVEELADGIASTLTRPTAFGKAPREPDAAVEETEHFLAEIQAIAGELATKSIN